MCILCYKCAFAQININSQIRLQLDSLVNETYTSGKPGGIVSIIKEGQVLYHKCKGLSNIEFDIPISDSTMFDIGSISKQFTAAVTLLLEENGKIKLDDDISLYLTEFKDLPYKVSIKNLLNHTHGLPNSNELADLCGKQRMSHEETIKMLLKINSANFQPGEQYEYNNTGYSLLTEIISRVENKPFNEVLKERIFEPLNMENTVVFDNPFQLIKNKAGSYVFSNNDYSYLYNDRTSMGPGGICTTISDLSLWAINFTYPKIGSKAMLEKMQKRTRLSSGEMINYGYGIQLKMYKGEEVVFHGGADASYRAYMMHFPNYKVSIIVLSNDGGFSALQLAYSLSDVFLQLKEENEYVEKRDVAKEKSYEGTYEMFPGKYFNIISRNDSLFFQQFGYSFEIPLDHTNGQTYNIPMLPNYKIEFKEDQFDFHIVDSKFKCKEVSIAAPSLNKEDLDKFTGVYLNEEFGIVYRIIVDNENLIAIGHENHINLIPLTKSSFYSSYQYFGKIDFVQNSRGDYSSFKLSGSLINGIMFNKI